jgi:hypothetical protein
VLLAAQGSVMAVATASGAVAASFDGGGQWLEARVPPTLGCLGIAAGRVVGAIFLESEDKSCLFVIGRDGIPRSVAEIAPTGCGLDAGDDESEGRGQATGLAWDEQRGVLWVAGGFGLRAFKPFQED